MLKENMVKYINTTGGPVVYDAEGRIVDGFSWVELEEDTPEATAAWQRGDLIKVASNGEFIYDSIEEPVEEDIVRPATPEDVSRIKSRKKLEG